MSDVSSSPSAGSSIPQDDFEKITALVTAEFRVEEALKESDVPTYYLKQPQETKQAFLRLLKNLERVNRIALLRRSGERVVLKVAPKPPVKPSNTLVNWVLFLATIATTFYTGYLLSDELVKRGAMPDPIVGGVAFTVAIMAVLGMHEMGHKLTANKRGIDATLPYFIPGPPLAYGGFGTFGAVILQKSLPPNRDALFDVGASGPIVGFILALIASIVGLAISPVYPITGPMESMPAPLFFDLFVMFVLHLPADHYILLHPIAFAGWVGMIVTMLNILPAAMLDGGHVARAIFGRRTRLVLSGLSFLMLIAGGFISMAFFVLFLSLFPHPGPLDDVSGLSIKRKLLTGLLVVILVLCSFIHYLVFDLLALLGL